MVLGGINGGIYWTFRFHEAFLLYMPIPSPESLIHTAFFFQHHAVRSPFCSFQLPCLLRSTMTPASPCAGPIPRPAVRLIAGIIRGLKFHHFSLNRSDPPYSLTVLLFTHPKTKTFACEQRGASNRDRGRGGCRIAIYIVSRMLATFSNTLPSLRSARLSTIFTSSPPVF